ncbi:SDR family oxidoreductase [Macrococcus brunensis]|uniref:SDR family oxidoreductase n=1 Tax=Macrococcus brunensis TaxID=198483 RepID=UPI001EF01A72|nr:SDR family oxidoreductase [Macrococcus brunensis]ULG71456.1 SDR family oxidoreductase [Macrococcus brunensis]ULG73753.1 SDR family oxidoreductase [Macrococcus brunensis]
MFKDKVVVITGGAAGIGRAAAERFRQEGAHVAVIDIQDNDYFIGDISRPEVLDQFHDKVKKDFGSIDILINNALPLMKGIDKCSYEEFLYAQQVGVAAPFYLSKLFKDDFTEQGSIINITSTRADMSQSQTESYAAAKGGLTSLTHALAVSLDIRVNAIAPGWIDTTHTDFSGANNSQHPAGRVGKPEDIVEMMLFLASNKAGFITGQVFTVDGGMTKQMIYHNDQGWQYNR